MSEPVPPAQSEPPDPQARSRRIEDIFILLCVVSLWPLVFGMEGLLFEIGLYVALAGLVFIFIRRVRRFRQAGRDLEAKRDS